MATFSLLKVWTDGTIDTIIAVIGVVLSLLPLTTVAFGVRLLCLHGFVQENPHGKRSYASNWILRSIQHRIELIFEHRHRWRDAPSSNARLRWSRIMTVVALEYSVPWYAAVDVGVLTVAGVIGALSTLGSVALCKGSGIALLLLYAAQLVLCLVLRPMAAIFGSVIAVTTLSLTIIGTGLQVYYLFRSKDDNVDLSSVTWVLTFSAVCDLLVLGVNLPKNFVDIVECIGAIWRHFHTLQSALWPPVLDVLRLSTSSLSLAPTGLLEDEMKFAVDSDEHVVGDDLEEDAIDDALFWSADGLALIPPYQMKGSDDFQWMMPCEGAHAEDATSVSSVLDDAARLIAVTAQIDFDELQASYAEMTI